MVICQQASEELQDHDSSDLFLWVFPTCRLLLYNKGSDSLLNMRTKIATAGFISASMNGYDLGSDQIVHCRLGGDNIRHLLHMFGQVNFREV